MDLDICTGFCEAYMRELISLVASLVGSGMVDLSIGLSCVVLFILGTVEVYIVAYQCVVC